MASLVTVETVAGAAVAALELRAGKLKRGVEVESFCCFCCRFFLLLRADEPPLDAFAMSCG